MNSLPMLHSLPFFESSILISSACSGAHLYLSSPIHNSNRNLKDQLSCYFDAIRQLPVLLVCSGWGHEAHCSRQLASWSRNEDSMRRRCNKIISYDMPCGAALWATADYLWLTFKRRECVAPQSVTLTRVSVYWVK